MKILIISYTYKPLITPVSIIWESIVDELQKNNHDIHILCAWKPGFKEIEKIEKTKIYRVGNKIFENLRSKKITKNKNDNFKSSNNKSILKLIYDKTWKKIYWPDHACLWFFSAKKKAEKLMETNQYDGMISVSLPFTSHLVGLSLKKIYPDIPWIVDMKDPFSFLNETPPNNFKIYNKLNKYIEKKVFDKSDFINLLNEKTKDIYSKLYPSNQNKMDISPPVIKIKDIKNINESIYSNKKGTIKLVFIGTLMKKIRNPKYFLKLFYELQKINSDIELHFVGTIGDCKKYFDEYEDIINKKIFLHGKVSHNKALGIMKNFDFLINIGNKTKYQLPSKLIEYIYFKKPIINFIYNRDDSSKLFLEEYPGVINIEKEMIKKKLKYEVNRLEKFINNPPEIKSRVVNKIISQYEVENVSKSYIKKLS